jgi:hypothetical protein
VNSKFAMRLLSGRLWLTVIAGLVFAYATYAKILNSEAVATILTMVFISYFQRGDRAAVDTANGNGSTSTTTTTETTKQPEGKTT